VIKKYW